MSSIQYHDYFTSWKKRISEATVQEIRWHERGDSENSFAPDSNSTSVTKTQTSLFCDIPGYRRSAC
jgi:hypothetical protein